MKLCASTVRMYWFVDKVRALVKHICWAVHKQTHTHRHNGWMDRWMDVSEQIAGALRLHQHSANTVCERAFRWKRYVWKRCEEKGSKHKQNNPYVRRDTQRELITLRCWCVFGTAYDRIEFILVYLILDSITIFCSVLFWLRLSHSNEFHSNSHMDIFGGR